MQEGKYFEKGGAGGIVEASEGGVEDCTGSEFLFVVTSGGAASDQGGGGGGPAGARGGTSFSRGLAGRSGWSGEGVVVGGAGGAAGEPSGSTGSTGCDGEGVGEKVMSIVGEGIEAFPLSIAVEGDGEVAGNGAGRQGNGAGRQRNGAGKQRNRAGRQKNQYVLI